MKYREKCTKILDFLSDKKILEMEGKGFKVSNLEKSLKEELEISDLAVNSIDIILDKIEIALDESVINEFMEIRHGKRHSSRSCNEESSNQLQNKFWSNGIKMWKYK